MSSNVIPLPIRPADILAEAHPGLTPSSTALLPATVDTTLSSTMALTGRTNLTVSPDEWRKPQRRKVYAALDALFPDGLPIEFQSKKVAAEVVSYCVEKGWPEPKPKTVQRAIRDRYPALTAGST